MIRPLAIGLIAFACASGVPATVAAQDLEQFRAEPLELAVRMTAPAGGLWQTPVPWIPATRGRVLPSLYASLIVLEAYDGYSTTRGLKNGAIESNTFMRRLAAEPAALWAVKGGATFVSIYVAERLWRKGHHGQAIVVMVATNGLMAAVAMNNASVLRTLK
jgi:Domain of unknown function (DUF5658)